MDLELGSLPSWQHTEFQASLSYIARLYQKHRKESYLRKRAKNHIEIAGQSPGAGAERSVQARVGEKVAGRANCR